MFKNPTRAKRCTYHLQVDLIAAFDASPDCVLIIDEQGVIQAANPAAETGFGYAVGELVGEKVNVLMPAHDRDHHDEYLHAYATTGRASVVGIARDFYGQRRDGSIFPLHLSVGEFEHEGRPHYIGIGHDVSEQRERQREVRRLATYDDLTGALNRATAVARLRARLANAGEDDAIAVLFIDLNNFKQVNDRFGHAFGDEVLRVMAERFGAHIRGHDLLARVGGDEFLAVVETRGDQAIAQRVAERLSEAAQEPIALGRQLVALSANIGISHFPGDGVDADELVDNADIAMYEAKRAGEDAPRRFTGDLRAERARSFDLRDRLVAAFDRHELVLHYQPQVDLESGRVVGLEALVRWHHPERGLLEPDAFLPTLEAAGLLPRLTPYVLDQACRDNALLIAAGELDVPVAVNVSPGCLASRHVLPQIEEALADHALPADRLGIELAETGSTASHALGRRHAEALHDLGVTIAMDDFGTGQSSIAGLREHGFSALKIDRTFVGELPGTDLDSSLVTGMLGIGRGLGIPVVAEGVETEEQRDFLLAHGCRVGQGWLYAEAMPLEELRAWLPTARTGAVPAARRAPEVRTGV